MGKVKSSSRQTRPSPVRIRSISQTLDRIVEVIGCFPELRKKLPKEAVHKAYWEKAVQKNAQTRRHLEILQELPGFTNLEPARRGAAYWKKVFGTQGEAAHHLLGRIVYWTKYKSPHKKEVRYWRERFGPQELVQRVRPKESDAYIPNPHRGTTTFQRFQGDPIYPGLAWSDTDGPVTFKQVRTLKSNQKYIPWTTLAYLRWPWRWLEPKKGAYNWKLIDRALKTARARGQTAQLRFQPYTRRMAYADEPIKARRHPPERSVNVPDWYWDTGARWIKKGVYAPNEPDCNDPKYLHHFGQFIRAFGRRYDGHPDLESIDLAYAGFWGESGGNTTPKTGAKLIEIYLSSFKKTQLLSMLGTPGCAHAERRTKNTRQHIGIRFDCFGDLRVKHTPDVPPELCWNHMLDGYPRSMALNDVGDAWKNAPVTGEACGTVASWHLGFHDLDFIIEQGYKYHLSVFMPKNVFFPEACMDKLIAFDKKIGYRFALRQALLPLECKRGKTIALECFVDNVGCAPIYRPYQLALNFRQGQSNRIICLKEDIRTWMPGHKWFKEKITVPKGLAKGEVKVDLVIVDEKKKPRVWFAMEGTKVNGWHPLTSMDVV